MNRRRFLGASAAAAAAGGVASAADQSMNQYYELRTYRLRTNSSGQANRLSAFWEEHHLPMTKRLGIGPVGYFQVYLGPEMPKMVQLTAFESLAAMETKMAAMAADKAWNKAVKDLGADPNPAFERIESSLLRAFDGMPKLELPAVGKDKPGRLFDMRCYESDSATASAAKIDMFNQEEIKIFRRSGIQPVFFGQTIVGSRMPNLTYMVCYDDMAGRDAAWKKFLDDPDWKRIRVKPGWTDAEIVSNITNTFLRPLPFSPIR
jgi:hypothetical protein